MLVKRLRELGQEHIASLLNSDGNPLIKERIMSDLQGVDLDLVGRLIRGEALYKPPRGDVEPADVIQGHSPHQKRRIRISIAARNF